jgi:hypothetical protein
MPIGVHRDLDARMPQLLGHVLNGRMVLIELDGGIAVSQIVDAIDAQRRQCTDPPMDRIEPYGRCKKSLEGWSSSPGGR